MWEFSEEVFSLLLDLSGFPMLVLDEELKIQLTNKEACVLLGFSEEELREKKRPFADFLRFKDLHELEDFQQNKSVKEFHLTLVNSEGQHKETVVRIKTTPDGKGFLVSLIDVTEFKKIAEKLTRRTKCQDALMKIVAQVLKGDIENLYQFLLEKAVETVPGAQAGSVLVREKGLFVYKAAVGYDLSELSKIHFKERELAQRLVKDVMIVTDFSANEQLDETRRKILEDAGKFRQIKVMLTIPIVVQEQTVGFFNLDNFENVKIFDDESIEMGKIFAAQLGVIFERLRLEEQIKNQMQQMRFLSYHDPLTTLANRRYLQEEAERIFASSDRRKETVSVLYLDLSNFKQINDNFSHEIGDKVLIEIAKRLKKSTRKSDFVSRIGGDEFIFLLTNTSTEGATKFAKRIIQQIEVPIIIDATTFTVSGNIGIAEYPKDGDHFEKVLRNADIAMYRAKSQKKPYCIFES